MTTVLMNDKPLAAPSSCEGREDQLLCLLEKFEGKISGEQFGGILSAAD